MSGYTLVSARMLLRSLLPVGAALLVVGFIAPMWGSQLQLHLDVWQNLTAPLAVLGLLFAMLFGQWRLVSAVVLVVGAYLLIESPPPNMLPGTERFAALLPTLGLITLALLPERGFAGPAPFVATAVIVITLLTVTRGIPGVEPAALDSIVLHFGGFEAALPPIIVAGAALPVVANQFGRPAVTRGAILAAIICMVPVVDSVAHPSDVLLYASAAIAALWVGLAAYAWQLAFVDDLTGLPNRRALKRRLRGDPPAVAIVDIDHFKSINDTYGHQVGDQVLRHVAAVLSRELGFSAYRYGGEEFAIVMRTRDPERARRGLERLRRRLCESPFRLRGRFRRAMMRGQGGGERLTVTASFGLALVQRDETGFEALKRADAALYDAKEAGRNRVAISPDPDWADQPDPFGT